MKKNILLSTLLALSLCACGGGGSNPAPTPAPVPTPTPTPTPEAAWNKDRTFEVLVLSNSANSALASTTAEYESLANKVKGLPADSYSMIIAEQANMTNGANPALAFPLPLKQYGYFNLHSYKNGEAEAGLVVSKTWVSETHQTEMHSGSYLLHFSLPLKGTTSKGLVFPLNICTFRISTADEATGFANHVGELTSVRLPHLLFGFVANDQLNAFSKHCSGVADYVLTKVDKVSITGYTYVCFAPKSFKLREVKDIFTLGNVKAMNLAIETGVNS